MIRLIREVEEGHPHPLGRTTGRVLARCAAVCRCIGCADTIRALPIEEPT